MAFSANAGVALALMALGGLLTTPAQAQFGSNLVVNGDAEAGAGAPGTGIVPIPGWSTTSDFTAVQYGAAGFPAATSPGPANRGFNFFGGGTNTLFSTASQTLNVASAASVIDAGGVTFSQSAYLGGFDTQTDYLVYRTVFQDGGGGVLGTSLLGPVTEADRAGVTGLLFRDTHGFVPVGTRDIVVTLEATRFQGSYDDGYADNVSLVLNRSAPVPEAGSFVSLGLLLAFGLGGLAVSRRKARAAA